MFEHDMDIKTNILMIANNFSYNTMIVDWHATTDSIVTIDNKSESVGNRSMCSMISDLMQRHMICASVAALGAAVNIDDIIKKYKDSKNSICSISFSKNFINIIFNNGEKINLL